MHQILYYLLYKIKNQPDLWIVKVYENISDLKYHIKDFKSSFEKYLIVKRYTNVRNVDFELERAQFKLFIMNEYDDLLFTTYYN